jgi:hypothetical protein
MTRKRAGTGLFQADVAPVHNRPSLVANQEITRFANIVVPKPTPDDRAQAVTYLARHDALDVADMLGLVVTP